MVMRYKYLLLFGIIIVAALFRLVAIGSNPPALTWDETAWGYNAYSLGIDGRDEFGRFLPMTYLESFGDFKPPVYAYLDILPVKILGLTEFSTRLPSAIAGIASVFVTFFLVLRLFSKSKYKYYYALVSSGILAISPWNIMLSRGAFEANVATFFIIAGVWAFLAGIQEKKWMLLLSAVCFVVPFYTFNSPRAFLPFFRPILAIGSWKVLWKYKKATIAAIIIGIVLLAPLVPFLLSPQAAVRFDEVNIFSDASLVQTSNQEIANDHGAWWSKIIHNRRVFYTEAFLQHYFDEFNPSYLFFKGDPNPKFSIQTTGELFIWCLPFFYAGWFLLFKKREGYWWIIPIWYLVGLIPASTARETPHALRTELVLPTVQILIAYALVSFVSFINEKKWQRIPIGNIAIILLSLLMIFELVKFTHSYIVHYPIEYSEDWQYGYKQSIAYVEANQQKYDEVEMSGVLGRPYIYYLFYLKVPPAYYRSHADITRDVFGFVTVHSFGKYHFQDNLSTMATANKHILYIEDPQSVPTNAQVLQIFNNIDGTPALVAYTE